MARSAPDVRDESSKPRISPATWTVIAVLAGSALLGYTGATTGEWRGVVVTEVQILAVGFVTWLVLRWGED